jgi:SpoVK/Ycf46/Vps4 family AAA+-type ATPase
MSDEISRAGLTIEEVPSGPRLASAPVAAEDAPFVLTAGAWQELRRIAARIRAADSRVRALFAGEDAGARLFAARVLALELRLPLFRIDLAGVVSKYIGETEKNLSFLFDAAERSGAILFFDEADALFGKRSAIRDAHDKYANLEVSYLLQRLQEYPGVGIVAVTRRSDVAAALLKVFGFIVATDRK